MSDFWNIVKLLFNGLKSKFRKLNYSTLNKNKFETRPNCGLQIIFFFLIIIIIIIMIIKNYYSNKFIELFSFEMSEHSTKSFFKELSNGFRGTGRGGEDRYVL